MKNKIKAVVMLIIATVIFTICLLYSVKMEPRYIFKTNGYFLEDGKDKKYSSGSFGVEKDSKLQIRMQLSTGNEKEASIKLVSPSGKIYEEKGSDIKSSEVIKGEKGSWFFEVDGRNSKAGKYKLQVIEGE